MISPPLLSTNILFSAYSESDFFGKCVFIALFMLSLLTWYILVQKVLLFRKIQNEGNKIQELFDKEIKNSLDLPHEVQTSILFSSTLNPFAKLFQDFRKKAIELLDKNHYFIEHFGKKETPNVFLSRGDIELIESYMVGLISKETKSLEKNLFILSTTVSLAPFLGILGTVWGILLCLSELQRGASVFSSSLIMSGLSTALATTVLGLVIAIPALISYNYLKNVLRILHSDMEEFGSSLITGVELQYRKVES